MPTRTIAMMSEKGGSGKTTTCVNLAVALAKLGKKTLVVDSDPQGNASLVLLKGVTPDPPTLYHVLVNETDAADAILKTATPGLDLMPADTLLAEANVTLASEMGRERRLVLAMRDLRAAYDFVIVDTSPSRTVVNANVLNYVAEVYATVDPGVFSLAGLIKLQTAVAEVVRFLDNKALTISGLILTQAQPNNLSRDIEEQLRATFGSLVHKTVIPESVKVGEAHTRFMSVLDWASRSPGALAYKALAKEILKHGSKSQRNGGGGDRASAIDRPGRADRTRRAG
jgi:chromosome partitioning protein